MNQFTEKYQRIVARYKDLGFRVDRAFVGCHSDQLSEISIAQGVKIPTSYIALMQVMGKESGNLFDGAIMTYPDVLELKISAIELCRDYGIPCETLDNALVFMHYGGYQYWYIVCDGSEDPAVWFMQEGCAAVASTNQPLSDLVSWYCSCRLAYFSANPARLNYFKNAYAKEPEVELDY